MSINRESAGMSINRESAEMSINRESADMSINRESAGYSSLAYMILTLELASHILFSLTTPMYWC